MTAPGGVRVAAAIDVGSNSVLLLVVTVGADGVARAIDEAAATTRLGTGLRAGGALDSVAAARTRDAVAGFAARARTAGAGDVWAFATGAARRATDGPAFAAATARAAAAPVEILSGEREARLAYAAAVHGLGLAAGPVLVVDVGGATTELTLGDGAAIAASASLPIGALALAEACGDDAGAVATHVQSALAATDLPTRAAAAGATCVASGGTATSLAALALGLPRYDPARVHGAAIARRRFADLATAASRHPGPVDPGRAAILPAGACILDVVMTAAGYEEARVSDHGVRHAYLRERLADVGVEADMRAPWR